MSTLLAIDPGLRTGWAVIGARGWPVACGTLTGGDDRGSALASILHDLRAVLATSGESVTRWAVEAVGWRGSLRADRALWQAEGVARAVCATAGLGEPTEVPISSWKAACGVGGRAEPSLYEAAIRRLYPSLVIDGPDAAAAVGIGVWAWSRVFGDARRKES